MSEHIFPNIRKFFRPDPGMTFFDTDLSSADLRIVTWEADEPEMKRWLADGKVPYVEVAKEFYRDPSITKKHRSYKLMKSLCHGTHYLGTPAGLSSRVGLPVKEVARVQGWYFERFPRIRAWQEEFKRKVRETREVRNPFGYRIPVLGRIEDSTYRELIAWLPQSTVACLINRIYDTIYRTAPEIEVLLQVHDSIAGQFPTDLTEPCLVKINAAARIVLPYAGPLIIPVGVKTSIDSWGECE